MKTLPKICYFIVFALIVGTFFYERFYYSNLAKHSFTLDNYLQNPQMYGKYTDERFGRVINISSDHFYFNLGDRIIKVYGHGINKAIYGESAVFLSYNKDGRIEMIDYHNYDYNYLVYAISFLALIVFIVIFFKEWRITSRGFVNA